MHKLVVSLQKASGLVRDYHVNAAETIDTVLSYEFLTLEARSHHRQAISAGVVHMFVQHLLCASSVTDRKLRLLRRLRVRIHALMPPT